MFAIYAINVSTKKFKYRLTRVGTPPAAPAGSPTSTKLLNIREIRVSWPAAKVVTTTAHDYLPEEIVTIAGISDATFNGEFLLDGPKDATTFYYRLPSVPSADETYNAPGPTSARVVYRFDEVMRILPARARIRLSSGIFETRGWSPFRPNYDPQTGARVINWLIKSGQTISGAGMGATTVRLMYATSGPGMTLAFGHQPFSFAEPANPDLDSRFLEGFSLSDLTVDCYLGQQARDRVGKAAVHVSGTGTRLRRVRAIDFGSHVELIECFVLGVATADPRLPEPVDCRIEDCVIEQPSLNSQNNHSCLILFSGEESSSGRMGWHRACAIRNNYINHEYVDQGTRYSSQRISIQKVERDPSDTLGLTAILTAYTPHHRTAGQWVFVWQTAFPLPDGTAPYYGRFLVLADGLTTTTLKYRMNAVPRVPGVKDANPPSGYAVDGIFIGANSVGFSTDGGSEAVAEGNRVFNAAVGGSYHDTWGTKDQTDRNNYYSNVTLGPFQNMGSSSALKLAASVNVTGTSATVTTTEEHGMVVGQAVRITSAATLPLVEAFYRINAVTASTFSFDTEGVSLPGSYFAALWQVRQSVQENNVIELEDASHVGQGFGQAIGLALFSGLHGTGKKVFQSLISRANVVTSQPRLISSLSPPRGIHLLDGDQAIVDDNAIDVLDVYPIFVARSGPLYLSENASVASGKRIDPSLGVDTEDIPPSLASRIEDALLLSL